MEERKQLVYFDYQDVDSLCLRHHFVNSWYVSIILLILS